MITENNKLIAEFMDWENYVNDGVLQLYKKENKVRALGQLYFNSDWNWLMDVVSKLSEDSMYYLAFDDVESTNWNKLQLGLKGAVVGNMELVYNACVEFIKWYNQQSK